MIYKIETDDRNEAKTLVKAQDMASLLWEIKHNFWRKWKHDETDFNLDNYKEALADLMDEYNINIDNLIQ